MKAVHLQTEYLTEPLGLDILQPRFYWQCEGGVTQTAYQIIAKRGEEILWDSGKVSSSSMTHIPYQGKPLRSRDIVTWSVCLWDEAGIRGEVSKSHFEMGLLDAGDWTAKWIAGDYKPDKKKRYPVDCFRKEFTLGLTQRKVERARLYATAMGVYDVSINGKRIEDFILAPGMTDYRKRIQYQVYDVTALLCEENSLELRLADGWFRGSVAAYGVVNVFGSQTAVMAQMEIIFSDGSKVVIESDDSFAWSNDGPIRFADLKDGEKYNAQKKPGYGSYAKVISAGKGMKVIPTASNNVSVREKERFKPTLLVAGDGTKVLDFGQNIAGYLEFDIQGEPGQKLTLVCGEVLDKDGHVNLSGIQESRPTKGWSQMSLIKKLVGAQLKGNLEYTPKQEIQFLCSGGKDHYKTSFAVFGFRYAQIASDIAIHSDDFSAIAVYSDMEETGMFSCSNKLVNQLFENTRWSMKGNFLDIPTDCPTRERLGWTGDAQIFFNTGAYLCNTAAFFRKWLRDMEDNQYPNGLISAVLPYQGVEMMYKSTGVSVGWADCVYLLPYRYFKRYGDKTILKQCWPMMKKYTDYLMGNLGLSDKKKGKANPDNSYTYEKGVHLGEWLEPEEFRDKVYGAKAKHPEECTAYLYLTMKIMMEVADVLGEKAYKEQLAPYMKGAKRAYHNLFVKTGTLDTDRQAKLVRPLALGLLEGEEKANAQKRLVKAVENYQYRVGTGFLSTPFVLPVLTEAGEAETAYKMLENTKKPGWLSEILDGATTVWESWEGDLSQNHYSPGAVCEWLFSTVAGIQPEGERHFVIAPVPGGSFTYAEGSYKSLYGEVKCRWEKTENGICYVIQIPANTTATISLPDGTVQEAGAGIYSFA